MADYGRVTELVFAPARGHWQAAIFASEVRGNKKERVPVGPTLNDQPSENGSYEKLLVLLYAF